MRASTRLILASCVLAAIVACLFPPWRGDFEGRVSRGTHWGFLWTDYQSYGVLFRLDTARLVLELAVIAGAGALVWLVQDAGGVRKPWSKRVAIVALLLGIASAVGMGTAYWLDARHQEPTEGASPSGQAASSPKEQQPSEELLERIRVQREKLKKEGKNP